MKKRKILLLLAAMLLLGVSMNLTNVKAATVTYDYKNTIFGQRTKEDIVKEYSKALNAGNDTYESGNSSTYYSTQASTKSPYNQGILTNDTLASMEGMTNFFRYLAGVESLKEQCTQNESLQYQALDRNFEFNHYIKNDSKPADMSDELWQKGFACDHNILAMGYTPSGAITGWINEGYDLRTKSWDTLGHRYALISPQYSNIQFGYCGKIAIGKDVESKNSGLTEPFSAYPQAGYMPNSLVSASECAWSVQLNNTKVKISDISKVSVKVTNLSTNNSYVCTKTDDTARLYSSGILQFVQPSDATNGKYTDNYKVEITGLTDATTGDDATISYEVKFFDADQLADSYVKEVNPTQFSNLVVYKTMNTTEDLKKAAAVLPDEVEIKAASGYKTKIKVSGNWTLDEENHCYVNKADKSSLPSHITDKLGKLDKITIPYKISDNSFHAYNTLSVGGTIAEGNNIKMSVYRTLISYKHSKIFKIQENEDGTYKGILKFDRNTSPEYDEEASKNSSNSASDIYNFGPLQVSDSGEYISIYYSDSYTSDAYLSTSTKELSVKHKYEDKVVKPTCTEDGYTEHKCSVCGDTYRDSKTNKLGHDYKETVVEPTCTEGGYTEHKCSRCGDTYRDSKTNKLGHDYKETVVEPTCIEDGYTEHKCNRCENTYRDAETNKLGHDYKETVVEPTCTKGGYTEHKCSRCENTYRDAETNKLGHDYKETVVEPTCTEGGYTKHECSRCGDTYKDSETNKLGHKYEENAVVEPTCTEDGYIEYKCTVCKDTYRDVKNKLGHKYQDTTISPTCTMDGYILHKCTVCGYEYADKIDKLGHTIKLQNVKKPTYFAPGYTGDSVCTRCNEILQKGEVLKQLTLAKPTIKTTPSKKKIKLVIKKVSGATKYEIKVKLGKKTKTYYTTKTTYTLKKLKSKKKYTITVRAMAIQGKQKVYSLGVSKKVKVK